MADSPHTSARNQVRTQLRACDDLLSANEPNVTAEKRQVSNDSIRRLEDIIALQEDRLNNTRHRSGESLSHIRQLRTSMADMLLISKNTLEILRKSAKTLELAWDMLK